MEKYKIGEENVNCRIDKIIPILNENITRVATQKLLEEGKILVNDKKVKVSYKVKLDDIVSVEIPEVKETELIPENIDIDVLYEDEYIIVVNKAKGMVVHPANGNYTGTLVNALLYRCKDSLSGIGGEKRPGIVHRLDKDTSGLMLVAKDDKTHELLSEMFKEKQVHREYIALLDGVFPQEKAIIDAPIGRSREQFDKMEVRKDGKRAVTHLEVIKKYSKNTLVRLVLETGRTHQIRVHLSYIGYPVHNDPVYSKKESTEFGQFLHSAYLKFVHPITHKTLEFQEDLPLTFKDFIDNLE